MGRRLGKNKFQLEKKKKKKKIFQGDEGYCYIPYEYLTNSDLCFDVWTVRKVATDSFGQEHWDNYDTINYTYGHHHNHFDDQSRFIEGFDEDDDDFNQRNGFDNSWNPKNDFDNTWNQYQVYGGGLFIILFYYFVHFIYYQGIIIRKIIIIMDIMKDTTVNFLK